MTTALALIAALLATATGPSKNLELEGIALTGAVVTSSFPNKTQTKPAMFSVAYGSVSPANKASIAAWAGSQQRKPLAYILIGADGTEVSRTTGFNCTAVATHAASTVNVTCQQFTAR